MSDPAPEDAPEVAPGGPEPARKPAKKANRPGPGNLVWILLVGAGAAGIVALTVEPNGGTEVTLARLRAFLDDRGALPGAGAAGDAGLTDLKVGRNALTFTGPPELDPDYDVGADAADAPETVNYRVPIYSLGDAGRDRIVEDLDARGLPYDAADPPPQWVGLALFILPLALLLGLMVLLLRKFGGPGAAMSFGKSRGRLAAQDDVETTFADVAGIDEAKDELLEVVDFLKTPQKYQALGGRIPRGVLLVGPPGTGKTLLAKAVAGEAGVSFFSLSGSDFVEMFVGVGAARVRDMFKQAAEKERAIIFIDELDALGKARGNSGPGGHEEREQTLNALLVEMDGFDSGQSVIVMGATNRPETLDPALLRPGRFDRTVTVDRPDKTGRRAILKVHAKRIKLAAA